MGEDQNQGQAGDADDHGDANLRQRSQAERSEELRPRFISDREDEQAEEYRLEQRRNDEMSELSKQYGHYQRAGRGAHRESLELEPSEQRSKRHCEKQENFRCGRNDPLDGVHDSNPQAEARKVRSARVKLIDSSQAGRLSPRSFFRRSACLSKPSPPRGLSCRCRRTPPHRFPARRRC